MSEYETKLNLDNSTEHLKVVLDNIRIYNKELSNIFRQIKEGKTTLTEILDYREKVRKDTNRIVAGQIERTKQLDNKELGLVERENKVDIKEKELLKNISYAEQKLIEINKKISTQESLYNTNKSNFDNIVLDIKFNINNLKLETEQYKKDIQEQDKIKTKNSKEIYEQEKKIKENEKVLDNLEKDHKKKLESIGKEIELEKEKIKNPYLLIKEENIKLDKRFKDLAILESRLRKQFMKLNPDKILPLELNKE